MDATSSTVNVSDVLKPEILCGMKGEEKKKRGSIKKKTTREKTCVGMRERIFKKSNEINKLNLFQSWVQALNRHGHVRPALMTNLGTGATRANIIVISQFCIKGYILL
jgi:hypothetical protein